MGWKKRDRGVLIAVPLPVISSSAPASDSHSIAAKYVEDEFLAGRKGPSACGGGRETEKQWFRIHDGYVAQARQIIESQCFPAYKTKSDLYVHAVVRHIHWLAQLAPGCADDSVLHQLDQIDELVAHEERQIKFVKAIDAIAAVIIDLLEIPSGKTRVGYVLRKIRRHIEGMRRDFYRAYFEKMFNERFKAYEQAGLLIFSDGKPGDGAGDEQDEELLEMSAELLQVIHPAGGGD